MKAGGPRTKGNKDWNKKAPFWEPTYSSGCEALRGGSHNLIDHRSADGKGTYFAEPYQLDSEDILALAEFIKEGWQIDVDSRSVWNPGNCIVIYYKKRGEQK